MLMLSIAPYYSLYKIIINNMLLVFFYNSKCKKLCFISYMIYNTRLGVIFNLILALVREVLI